MQAIILIFSLKPSLSKVDWRTDVFKRCLLIVYFFPFEGSEVLIWSSEAIHARYPSWSHMAAIEKQIQDQLVSVYCTNHWAKAALTEAVSSTLKVNYPGHNAWQYSVHILYSACCRLLFS